MFSQTTEYAIRALIEIATRPPDEQVLSSELGEALGIPHHYLSKILQQLVRTRTLKSTRGRQGGFALARPAGRIKLRDIVEPFEDLKKYEECVLGQAVCSDAGACPLHEFWAEVRERFLKELDDKTLEDLADFQLSHLNSMNPGLRRRVGNVPGKAALKSRPGKSSSKKR